MLTHPVNARWPCTYVGAECAGHCCAQPGSHVAAHGRPHRPVCVSTQEVQQQEGSRGVREQSNIGQQAYVKRRVREQSSNGQQAYAKGPQATGADKARSGERHRYMYLKYTYIIACARTSYRHTITK
jgi:hypothetical protein